MMEEEESNLMFALDLRLDPVDERKEERVAMACVKLLWEEGINDPKV